MHARMLSHFSHVQLFVIPWTVARQAPLSVEVQSDRILRPEVVALMPQEDSRAQWEEDRLLFFPDKDSANKNSWTFCL